MVTINMLWVVIILDLIIPFVPITSFFLIYVVLAKPAFFRQWVEKLYNPSPQEKV